MAQSSGGGGLPSEYQQVEYLRNDGSSYILTGITSFADDVVYEIKFKWTRYGIIGFAAAGVQIYCYGSDRGLVRIGSSNSHTAYINYPSVQADNQIAADSDGYYTAVLDIANLQAYLNGEQLVPYGGSFAKVAFSQDMPIFARRNAAGAIQNIAQSSYVCYFKAYNGTTLEDYVNFIPCYRKLDNEPGMYDIVNDVFYTNAGSGSLVVGADV